MTARSAATSSAPGPPQRLARWAQVVRRHWWLITAAAVGIHLVAWTFSNPQRQQVNWILFTSSPPLGLVIAVAVVLGALLAVLISHQRLLGNPDTKTVMPQRHKGAGAQHGNGEGEPRA